MKRLSIVLFLLIFSNLCMASQSLYEGEWGYYNSLPSGEKAIHILPGDDLQYDGSESLNSDKATENISSYQGTLCGWIQPNWSSDYNGTSYVFDCGAVKFYWDGANTRWAATVNGISIYKSDTFMAAAKTYFHLTWDSNAPTLDLEIDGSSATQVTSAQTTATISAKYVGQDSSSDYHFNGKIKYRASHQIESSFYGAGAGSSDMLIIDSDTGVLDNYTDSETSITFWHRGKHSTAASDNANDTDITVDSGADKVFKDDEDVNYEDGTGYHKQAVMDGDATDANAKVDDGAGGLVSGLSKVGSFVNCDLQYQTEGGDILDIGEEDFEISFWMTFPVSPDSNTYIIFKGIYIGYPNSYGVYVNLNNMLTLRANDGTNDGWFTYYITSLIGDAWHHFHFFVDRSDISSCELYIDGVSKSIATHGTFPVLTLNNGYNFKGGNWIGSIKDIRVKIGGTKTTPAQILYQSTHPLDYSASSWTLDGTREAWKLNENTGTTCAAEITSPGNDLTLSDVAAWSHKTHLSKNLLADGDMEGPMGAWTIVGTPTTNDKESDTDSGTQSLHWVSDAADEGYSQVISASNGDKLYLCQRHAVTAGSFKINVTNGGGDIETVINDAAFTELEKIISATGNLTVQWLSEQANDDVNISRVIIRQCVAGNTLASTRKYTLVYNTDTGVTGAAWSGLGSEATEVAAGDLYIPLDEADASTNTKGDGFVPLSNPVYIGE